MSALRPSVEALRLCVPGILAANVAAFAAAPTKSELDSVIVQAARVESGQSQRPFRQLEEWTRQAPSDPVLRTQLEGGFVRLLAPGTSFEARRFACKQLGIIGTDVSLPGLAPLLKDEATVGIACLALTTYPRGKADEILRTAAIRSSGLVKIQLIRTLADRCDPNSLNTLAVAARDPDLAVAGAAITGLGKLGGQAGWRMVALLRQNAKPELEPAFADASLRCAASLAAAGDRKTATAIYESILTSSQPVHIRRGAFTAILQLDPDHGKRRVLVTIRGGDPALKPVAIAAVRNLPVSSASAEFAKELPRLQPNEQVWLIDSLAARNDSAARNAIARSLASPAPAVRRAAIDALGRIGDARTVALLTPVLLATKDAEESRAVQASLVTLGGGQKTDAAIRSELKASTGTPRALLLAVLSQRLGARANPVLLAETTNADPVVAKSAFRELARTAESNDVPALLQKLDLVAEPGVRAEAESSAAQALARMTNATRASVVQAALAGAKSTDARCALLGLLPFCGNAASLDLLKAAVTDPNPKVRESGLQALADWPGVAAWDRLIAVYQKPESESFRRTALGGLVRIAGEENAQADSRLADRYMALLGGAHGDADLKLILGALGGAARPEALQLAVPLLSNSGVHAEAEVAVKRIAEAIKVKYPTAAKEALDKLHPPQ